MSEKDTIYRQDAIDALRDARHRFTVADEAGGFGTVKWSEDVIYFAAAERVLSDLPSAEPEIIRCKECKYKHLEDMVWNCPFGLPGGEDFFCAYGAKKETDCDYERAVEQLEHDILYEPTFNQDDGSM